ncbi:winged helix-turn-helix domain-containing protein [Antribacter sp. KLBMP9083]|uniref:Winged helix-turn-helix domain-containing protein n=1 Tax=Antribacter soli TaxID=2910976 RepID=A0AA41U8V3_9MICO|nr:AfsR/SARP family transcriptional regulator [Antribacter soli]MCF4123373.1 winged helix-turn-helix domain-containing protein [Antribacter soli]
MRFRILGPLEVEGAVEGGTMSAAMPRRVLAMLLLSHNQTVTVSSLVDELWGSHPPKLARKTVQTYIYQLRKHLDRPDARTSRIESSPLGYRLCVEPGELDLWEFKDAVQRGRAEVRGGDPVRALELWREALDLWRGPMLTDVHLGSLLEPHVAQIESDRIRLQEQLIDVALDLGEYRELLPELEKLAAANPLHEGFHAQLMTALSATGDRNGALTVFTGLRDRMVETLGLDPSARLTALQKAIIEGTLEHTPATTTGTPRPAVWPVAVTPAQLPPDSADIVGRGRERNEVMGLCRQAGGTAPQVVVLAGTAGVGKTALAVHAGHALRPEFPDGQLFAGLGAVVDPFDVLEHFLRALGVPPAQIPDRLSERTSLYRSWTAERRLLVVLDDAVHVETLAHLIPAGPGCAALITTRVGLPGLAGASVVRVGPLPTADGVRLLRRVTGDARVAREPDAAARLVELSDNLPLAIRAAAEKLSARPAWTVEELVTRMRDGEHRLQELVTRRLDPGASFEDAYLRLAPAYRWAFWRMSTIRRAGFTLQDVADALGTSVASAECPVAELVDANLLTIVDTRPDGGTSYRFPELIRLHALSRGEPPRSPVPADVRQWTAHGARWTRPLTALPQPVARGGRGTDATLASAATSSRPPSMTKAWPVM